MLAAADTTVGGTDISAVQEASQMVPEAAVPATACSLPVSSSQADEAVSMLIRVHSAITGDCLCTLTLPEDGTIACLRRAVLGQGTTDRGLTFDLLHGSELLLEDGLTLAAAGVRDGSVVYQLIRRFKASDFLVSRFSERALGCLRFLHKPSGAEILLRGVRCGVGKGSSPMSVEFYSEPAFVEDAEGGGVFAHYLKIIGEYRADEGSTRRVTVKRPMRFRSDVVVARQSEGQLWVSFKPDAVPKPDRLCAMSDVYSGARLEVLSGSDEEWLHVRSPLHGEGRVSRKDVEGLGKLSLDWAGPEEVLLESVLR
eukprot:TRINITY_DN85645_c0_g1_i1.p1 TRINITY_DN85645_c0_g1~~TRINITY_DN85645_c0_g1_i1.p1  ORF type:complete len:312 (-),score=74.89 TRINITY_DN85645_c0_g1_i1:100-1035(-)